MTCEYCDIVADENKKLVDEIDEQKDEISRLNDIIKEAQYELNKV